MNLGKLLSLIPKPELRGFWGKIPLPDQNLAGIPNRQFCSLQFAWALYCFKLFQSPIAMPNMGSRRCSYEQATIGDGLLRALRNSIYETNIYIYICKNKHEQNYGASELHSLPIGISFITRSVACV